MTTEEFRIEVPNPNDLGKYLTEAIQAHDTQAVVPLKAGSHYIAYLTIPLNYETREDGITYVVAGGFDIAVLEPADEDTQDSGAATFPAAALEDFQVGTEIQAKGVVSGIPWVVAKAPKRHEPACNGYIRLPDGHPWLGLDYDDLIRRTAVEDPTYIEYPWIGFDTLHDFQVWPGADPVWGPPNMTVEKVIEDAKAFALDAYNARNTHDYQI